MNLSFSYNKEKDLENFILSTKSVNNSKPTKLHDLYVKKFGDNIEISKVQKLVMEYIEENNINTETKVGTIKNTWILIENNFIKRVEEIFGIKYPKENIRVFLTTNSRCTYNTEEDYFFVNMQSKNTNPIIMHELLHFYTYQTFYKELEQRGISKLQYNDIKESLTELLNIEFSNLMEGIEDKGYSQHTKMRNKVKETWLKTKNIRVLVNSLIGI